MENTGGGGPKSAAAVGRSPTARTPGSPDVPWLRDQAPAFLGSPWQRLYFLPEPQGQGALRSTSP